MPIFRKTPFADKVLPTYSLGKVIPVLSARELLGSRAHQAVITQLRQMVDLPDDEFDALYLRFLERYAEMVQIIPRKANATLSSLLNLGLLRGINALHYALESDMEMDAVEQYALFTAGVLHEIAAILSKQAVSITEKGGTFLSAWEFSQGSLHAQGAEWYKLLPYKTNYTRLQDPLTVLLAQQIMPADGYAWIARYWSVFVDWLDALCLQNLEGSRFNFILSKVPLEEEFWLIVDLPDVDVVIADATDTILADTFFEWLDNQVERDELKTEGADPDLYLMNGGVFIDSSVIDRFSKYYNSPSTIVFFHIGNCMGIAKKSGQDFRFDQFFGGKSGLLQSGRTLVKGLYVSDKFLSAKGSTRTVALQGKAPSREFASIATHQNQLGVQKKNR